MENIKIKDLAIKYGIFAKKSLGQNFIFNLDLTDKIVSNAKISQNDNIVEVGSGVGSLTFSILKKNPKKLTIIEKDQRCINLLQDLTKSIANKIDTKIEIIEADFLEINLSQIFTEKTKVISNLPYNIASKILFLLIDHRQNIELMILMFQKEVCQRIIADNNSKKYGRISVMVNFLCQTKYLFDISASNFTPIPKVESGLVCIMPRKEAIFDIDLNLLEKITATAFNQRRKMLKSSLKSLNKNSQFWLEKAKIDPNLRPENLSLEDFAHLVKNWS